MDGDALSHHSAIPMALGGNCAAILPAFGGFPAILEEAGAHGVVPIAVVAVDGDIGGRMVRAARLGAVDRVAVAGAVRRNRVLVGRSKYDLLEIRRILAVGATIALRFGSFPFAGNSTLFDPVLGTRREKKGNERAGGKAFAGHGRGYLSSYGLGVERLGRSLGRSFNGANPILSQLLRSLGDGSPIGIGGNGEDGAIEVSCAKMLQWGQPHPIPAR